MVGRHTVWRCAGMLAFAACSSSTGPRAGASCGAGATQLSLAVAGYSSIDPATDSGCVTFPANPSPDTAEYLVLPWSAGGTPASSAPFTLQSARPQAVIAMQQIARLAPALSGGARSAHGPLAVAFDRFLRESARAGRYSSPARSAGGAGRVSRASLAGPPTVGSLRTFRVCANTTCSSFDNVGAVVRSVGAHIAIYVDTLAPSPGLTASDLDSLKGVFDTRLYPLDTLTFGHVSIVADSNATLSCAHKPSDVNNVTPVTFTHEFQHMINFVEHVLVKNANSEEGWLDEGLSKYAEEIAGRSFGDNAHFSQFAIGDVYDAYQYLAATGTSPLLIPEDTGSLAEVGASWLFTRYIVDQFGDSLPGRLVRTSFTGAANVQAQTGQSFAQTVSRWALANWVSDLPGFSAPSELQYTAWHFRSTYSNLHSQDPTDFPLAYPLVPTVSAGNVVNRSGKLWSGSGEYVRAVQAPNGAAFTLHLSGAGGTAVSPAVIPRLVVLRIR